MKTKQSVIFKALFSAVFTISLAFCLTTCSTKESDSWIRINQLGYLPNAIKVAVLGSKDDISISSFSIHDAKTGEEIQTLSTIESKGKYGPFSSSFRLDFSEFSEEGAYFIIANGVQSPVFPIHEEVYDKAADFLLKYMRQQRCGYNPYLKDSCHTTDGFIIYHPDKPDGTPIDVVGGWHDATDYLQYLPTSANAVFQLLFSYRENPEAFSDEHLSNGNPGKNGIPDVIDEAKFGMDWLLKMNPAPEEYYNQIADDRDHSGFRLPTQDSVKYHKDFEGRPVYFVNGEPQGLFKYQNRTTGVSSTAGKFASSFAIGAEVLQPFYPELAGILLQRAKEAYVFGKSKPGNTQTVPASAPYFYEEDNWADDMELASSELFRQTGDKFYKTEAKSFAKMEQITPWMGKDTARHYQYYPFYNAGHHELAAQLNGREQEEVLSYYQKGLDLIYQKGKDNPFLIGIPFIWCSNNLVTAAISQAKLYRTLSGDDNYKVMEASLRDWLFGCNPWGTSMIVGLPENGDTPLYPHSSLNHLYAYQTDGGLVDGPVYGSIFNNLKGLQLMREDHYAPFQSPAAVYHDDVGDYSTNEPTMDGVASLVYYLSSMHSNVKKKTGFEYDNTGAIRKGNKYQKQLTLIFSGHEFADGGFTILKILKKYNIKGTFFFTGDFYRNDNFRPFLDSLVEHGHYLGAHSDKHLLYNDWTDKNLLVSEDQFKLDLENNYRELIRFGFNKNNALYFLPPYEWNDGSITKWTEDWGLRLINYSMGTLSHADYTTPKDPNYRSSEAIFNSVIEFEKSNGLNGFLLLTHVGTSPERKDKFYNRLDELIVDLNKKGYDFVSLQELLHE
jgi:peptidoglycan/xylan/chitin deacetylase (PgdA/CDA1 family)